MEGGCYTLIIADEGGDTLVQNGCHDPYLDFLADCACTPGGGYACWTLCTTSNCNEEVNLHKEFRAECRSDDRENDKENGSNSIPSSISALIFLFSLYSLH